MLITAMSTVPYEARFHYICIDGYDNGAVQGRLYSAFQDGALRFTSLMELVRMTNLVLDRAGIQATETQRSLQGTTVTPAQTCEPSENWKQFRCPKGGLATFQVTIQFRQHASWQGRVLWLEGRRTENFRSGLELFGMMDEILGAVSAPKCASV
jgi:hypothetical protein